MSNTPSRAEIEALVKRHGATSYRNRADTQNPAFGFSVAGLGSLLAEARNAALEEAAAAVEKATYSKRWSKAAVNSHPDDVPPCEFAALIRAMKEGKP